MKKYGYFHYEIPVHDTIARIISAIEPSHFQNYFINWMKEADELLAKSVRRHWSVENELHWVLDVSFRGGDN
ncbi:hypothetical protein B0W48_02370 [Pseudoalteromonas aliena]|uniref:ISAs1 family transposase n=1 Tax=Pseudoalteromonas aliena TaxID=247523 RepID=A0A1Q2GUF7_9GAMM|nr:hypothetical protein [Pseudoalteromonas aliena]AQP98745.1 hypothetical protein B0W48_02370 [Pseudoalteromonas aliena]